MSRNYAHHHQSRPQIVVHDHDVLSGRGVNIAHHSGNERFRTLVTSRADANYCTSYSASEKRAVAEEVIKHIHSLDPPGRFLKREGRGQVSRGLNGPWEVLSDREAIKKTCQALRDCNRVDRQGYAVGVAAPRDVIESAEKRNMSGLSGKQQAAAAAAAAAAVNNQPSPASLKRGRVDHFSAHAATADGAEAGRVSPSVENAAEWLKKQRTEEGVVPVAAMGHPDMLGAHHMPPSAEHHMPPPEHAHPGPAYHHDPNGIVNGAAPAPWPGHAQAVPPAPAPGYPPMENIPGEDSLNITEL